MPGVRYVVTTSAEGMVLRLPEIARGSISVWHSASSTHDFHVEQYDTASAGLINDLDGVVGASKLIPVAVKGLRHYFQGNRGNGTWEKTEPLPPISKIHFSQSDAPFNYSEEVLLRGIPKNHLLMMTNTSREFGRTISLDGTRTLQMKRSNFSPSESVNATSFSIPPNGVATVSHDNDTVFVTIAASRDMGYFSSLALLTAIN